MLFKTLILEKNNHISIIKINRPKALNAINIQVLCELSCALQEVENDITQKALIITGTGKKSFVAGADIHEMQSFSSPKAQEFSELGHRTFDFIGKMRMPVIAAVNGFAFGGGLELALACDFIYASKNALFGLVETSLGLIPGFGGIGRLKLRIGQAKASEMIFSAEKINADTAFNLGLINKIISDDVLQQSVVCAEKIVLQAPKAVTSCKKLLQIGAEMELKIVNLMEQQSFSMIFFTTDQKEGIDAFISKRKPTFRGR